MKKIKSDFISKGVRCDGDFLMPPRVKKPPVVIMAHGLALQKNFGLMSFAEKFLERKMAVFIFDYRTFGKSDGTPRQVADPFRHLEDWKAAIDHVRKQDMVDGSRIALWGYSFSGGHVIAVAAEDRYISAVVALAPYAGFGEAVKERTIQDIIKSTVYGFYDIIRKILGLSPHYSLVVARPGTFAALNSEGTYEGYLAIVGKDADWKNMLTSRVFIKMVFYNMLHRARKVKAPVLLLAGENDSIIHLSTARKFASRLPQCEMVVMNSDHFQPFSGRIFKKYIGKHVSFLEKHLF